MGILRNLDDAKKARLEKMSLRILGILFLLQLYFVRELLAAELIFGLGFAALFVICGIIFLVGNLAERAFAWSESHIRALGRHAWRTAEEN